LFSQRFFPKPGRPLWETLLRLAQSADDINALARDVADAFKHGKYSKALPLAERTLALAIS